MVGGQRVGMTTVGGQRVGMTTAAAEAVKAQAVSVPGMSAQHRLVQERAKKTRNAIPCPMR